MSIASAEYRLLEGLPVPAAVVCGTRVLHANAALAALLGLSAEELVATPLTVLMSRFVSPDQPWVEPSSIPLGERPSAGPMWLRVRGAGGQERTLVLRYAPGLSRNESVALLVDAEGEDGVRRLTEALVTAAAVMLRCREEEAVLETAVDAVHRQGFYVSTILIEGENFRHGPVRQEAASIAATERLFGMPTAQVRFPRAALPHLEEILARRKAAFHPDMIALAEGLQLPEMAEILRNTYPPDVRGLDAPIYVAGEPYGLLCAQSPTLTPAGAGTLELFAQLVGGALENVRHHHIAAARLAEVSQLQGELVAHERLTVLGEAAGVVAHEVRNPLGAILNAVAVLKREAHLGPTGQAAVGMLEEEAIRLEDIVRDLLDVVRPMEPRPRQVQLTELVRRAVGQLQGRGETNSVRITVDEASGVPSLAGDETLLQLAVTHLLRNALQASPARGLVRATVSRTSEGVSLVVEDEGPGISGRDPKRVFEPFFLTRANGRGLGLAIVRRVVLAHGGAVTAGERTGGGARFELVLPLAAPTRMSLA